MIHLPTQKPAGCGISSPVSCSRELSQFWRATSFGFSGLVFSVLRQTLPFFLIHACSPGLHSELLAFQGGSSSLHQCEKLELEYEFHLGPGLIVSELSAHLPAGGESRSVSSQPPGRHLGGGWEVLKPQRTAWLSVGVLSPDALRGGNLCQPLLWSWEVVSQDQHRPGASGSWPTQGFNHF